MKINNQKVLLRKDGNDIRIITENGKMWFSTLKAIVETYNSIRKLSDKRLLFNLDETKFNESLNPIILGNDSTIETAFKLYEFVRKECKLNIPAYSGIRYGEKTILFSPSDL